MIIKGGLRTLDETMVPSPRMPCFARIRRLAALGTQFFAQFCHFLSFFGLKFSFFFIFFEKNVSFFSFFFKLLTMQPAHISILAIESEVSLKETL